MSKEMERLKSIIRFNKLFIIIYDYMNFTSNSNKYDKRIEEYQNELSDLYKRIQELKEEEDQWKSKYQYFTIKIKNILMII